MSSETPSFLEPQFLYCQVETLVPTRMSSYYMPDTGKINNRGKMKFWMMVLFCSQIMQDRVPERLRSGRNQWDQARGGFR